MYYLGVDLGGMSIKAGVVDETGRILCSDKVHTMRERNYTQIIRDMVDLCKTMVSKAGLTINDIESIYFSR